MKASSKLGAAAVAFVVMAGVSHGKHGHLGLGSLDSFGATPVGSSTSSANERLAMHMAKDAGWPRSQRRCLDWLWTRESGFQMVWNTAGSGAYGIPQALPASKMASAGSDYMTNPATDIRWGLSYVTGRYGDACRAWQHEEANSWY